MTLALLGLVSAATPDFQTLETEAGPVDFVLLVPEGEGPHPAVLALPPGPQTRAMVENGLSPWQSEMLAEGFLVVSPVAPDCGLYTAPCSHARIPALMDHVAAMHRAFRVVDWSQLKGWLTKEAAQRE